MYINNINPFIIWTVEQGGHKAKFVWWGYSLSLETLIYFDAIFIVKYYFGGTLLGRTARMNLVE